MNSRMHGATPTSIQVIVGIVIFLFLFMAGIAVLTAGSHSFDWDDERGPTLSENAARFTIVGKKAMMDVGYDEFYLLDNGSRVREEDFAGDDACFAQAGDQVVQDSDFKLHVILAGASGPLHGDADYPRCFANTNYTIVRVATVNSGGDVRYALSNGVEVDGYKFADGQVEFAKAGQTVRLDGNGVLHIVAPATQ